MLRRIAREKLTFRVQDINSSAISASVLLQLWNIHKISKCVTDVADDVTFY